MQAKAIATWAVACGLSVLSACHPIWQSQIESDLERFDTPAWFSFLKHNRVPNYLAYSRSQESDMAYFALITEGPTRFETNICYLYDPAERELVPGVIDELEVPVDAWKRLLPPLQTSALRRCELPSAEGILVRGECVASAGRSLVAVGHSPSAEMAVAVSADGDHYVQGTTVWGSGGRMALAYGQHYLQLFDGHSGREFGQPLRIPIETAREFASPTVNWLGRDDLIGIAPRSGEWISVIHVKDIVKPD